MIVEGKLCKKCNTTLKYMKKRQLLCVECTKVRSRKRYKEKGGYDYNKAYRKRNRDKLNEQTNENYRTNEKKYIYHMFKRAEYRAKKNDLAFSLDISDISIPEFCPILGVPLSIGKGGGPTPFSPSLDKIDPKKGYIKGNIIIVSMRANQIKSDASIFEIEKVLHFLKDLNK